jgi:glycosyltransferase involved in cell wall biosynthesis
MRCTLWLRRFLRAGQFDVIHTLMPKSGLLGMIAGRLAGTPLRFHTFTGQVWATRSGPMRALLKTMDRVLAACATRLLTDSVSQMNYLIDEGIVARERIEVLADGSICGVDVARFRRDPATRLRVRAELGVPDGGTLFMFLGRLTVEKGIAELLSAFREVAAVQPNAHLAIVGPTETDFDRDLADTAAASGGRMHRIGFTLTPQHYMSAADVFCLPSYREGFGTVIIEAAAAGLPTIASKIYGVTDAIDEGRTGLLHTVRDVAQMRDLMLRLIEDVTLRERLGAAAQERAITRFSEHRLVQAMLDFYSRERVKA